MIKNKNILIGVFVLGLVVFGGLVQMARALDTASVSATVTVQNIAVSLDGTDGSIAYGVLGVGASKSTVELGDTEKVKNSGNVTEKLSIKGESTSGCVWTLSGTVGADAYKHQFSTNGGSGFAALTGSYQTLAATIGVGISMPVDLMITVPSSSSCYSQATAGVTVLAETP